MASTYQWDNEGRMTSQQYPAVWLPQNTGPTTLQTAGYQYDANGRMNTMTWFNSLMQLTNQSLSGYMNMTYNHPATGNNGRIAGSVDSVAGETTAYSYDGVNRLTGASNSLWSATYGYDGFWESDVEERDGGAPLMTAAFDAGTIRWGAATTRTGISCTG